MLKMRALAFESALRGDQIKSKGLDLALLFWMCLNSAWKQAYMALLFAGGVPWQRSPISAAILVTIPLPLTDSEINPVTHFRTWLACEMKGKVKFLASKKCPTPKTEQKDGLSSLHILLSCMTFRTAASIMLSTQRWSQNWAWQSGWGENKRPLYF